MKIDKTILDVGFNKYDQYYAFDSFTLHGCIDKGGSAEILQCSWKNHPSIIILKCFESSNKEYDFIREVKILSKIGRHPNIIDFYGITKGDNEYHIILQYADNGNLRDYLEKIFTKLCWQNKLEIAKDIANGLSFIHDKDIIHRDLHSKNILIHKGQAKIADFGCSADDKNNEYGNINGLLPYIEPQYFINTKYYYKKSDIYSFGIILWEISSGKPPFQSLNNDNRAIICHILGENREIPVKNTPEKYRELYTKCWDYEPKKRPETKFVLETLKSLYSQHITK
ncbi:kinase-like domain-containing protein [Gigaspora rosea]|uniref:Kinase-like domain-containing protein n=1 Tax=Gigaspora rosea TaxID=44941 RepID=A0A397UEP7_9GLOM|nr:kinase-like domain-containing protein [Gigaspora rosea]